MIKSWSLPIGRRMVLWSRVVLYWPWRTTGKRIHIWVTLLQSQHILVLNWTSVWGNTLHSTTISVVHETKMRIGTPGHWMEEGEGSGDRFLVGCYGSLVGVSVLFHYPGSLVRNIISIIMLCTGSGDSSQYLNQESWKLEFFHLRNAAQHRKSRSDTHLNLQINRAPSHMGLIWRRCLLTQASLENTTPNGGNKSPS